jgi:formate dehydrogenase subunit gamma
LAKCFSIIWIRHAHRMKTDNIIAIIERERSNARAFLGPGENASTVLLPVLHALQKEYGFVDKAALPLIAEELNISQAELRGVISFYHDFRLEPAGRHMLKLCRAEACQSMGCEELARHIQQRYALAAGDTLPDGSLTFENVYCLGNCALAPAAMLDDDLIGRIDEKRIDAIIASARNAGAHL